MYKELGDVEFGKKEFKNALSFYTQGIGVKCKDDQLNAELYLCRWLSNYRLGEFTLTSVCKLSVLITVHSFQFYLARSLSHLPLGESVICFPVKLSELK